MTDTKEGKTITTVYITNKTYKKLKVFAARKLTSISDVMEQALLKYFEAK